MGGLLAILGLIFAIMSKRQNGNNKPNSIGFVTSIIGIVLTLIIFSLVSSISNEETNIRDSSTAENIPIENTTLEDTEITTEIISSEAITTENTTT